MNKFNSISEENFETKPLSRSEQKHLSILDAATTAFLESGYESVSMDTIADLAKVSKRTIYSHFGSKEDLFAGIMHVTCSEKRELMMSHLDMERPIQEVLTDVGQEFLTMMYDTQVIALLRILISKVDQFPGLGEIFFENGPKQCISIMGAYLQEQDRKGIIRVSDPEGTAESYMSSLFGSNQITALATNRPLPGPEEIEKTVDAAVDRFLYGVAVR